MNIRQRRHHFHHWEGLRFIPSTKKKRTHSSHFKKKDKKLTHFKPDGIFPYWLYQPVIIRYLPSRCAKVLSRSVVSDCLRPYGLQPAKLLYPWNSLGRNTGVSSHFLLQGIFPILQILHSCICSLNHSNFYMIGIVFTEFSTYWDKI